MQLNQTLAGILLLRVVEKMAACWSSISLYFICLWEHLHWPYSVDSSVGCQWEREIEREREIVHVFGVGVCPIYKMSYCIIVLSVHGVPKFSLFFFFALSSYWNLTLSDSNTEKTQKAVNRQQWFRRRSFYLPSPIFQPISTTGGEWSTTPMLMPSNEEADHSAASKCIVENPHIDLGRNPFSSTTKVLFPSGSWRKDEREARLWRAGGRYCQHDVIDGCVETASAWGYNGHDLSRKLLRAEEQEGEVVTSRCSSMPRWRHYSWRCWRGLHPPRLFFSPQQKLCRKAWWCRSGQGWLRTVGTQATSFSVSCWRTLLPALGILW